VKEWVWKETAEIIAVLGVIGSLIFVAFEIRQNTNAVRSSTIQAISEQSYESVRIAIENPELRAAIRAARQDELDSDQRDLMEMLFQATLRIRQNRYLQAQLGILDEETSSEIGGGGIYTVPYFRIWWEQNRTNYSPGFQAYMDRVQAQLSEMRYSQ